MTRLYAVGAALSIIAALLVGLGLWSYGRGKEAQARADASQISELIAARDSALAQARANGAALEQINAQAAAEKAQSEAQLQQAAAAVKQIAVAKADADRAAAQWQARYRAALATTACHVAQEEICPALSDY